MIDVLKNFFPGQDLLLVRCAHPAIGQGPIIAGMSGSPVYLDGRLAGAVAYAWPFGKEPLAGVTPVESMFADLDRPLETAAKPVGASESLSVGPYAPTLRRSDAQTVQASSTDVRPVRTPLVVSGLSAGAFTRLETVLSGYPFQVVRGGGAAAPAAGAAGAGGAPGVDEFGPGSALGVQLVRGDVDLTGVGTLTWRGGDRFLAFGHPMFNAGQIALPVSTARVHAVISSVYLPFKLASPGRPAGVLVKDRNASISGVVGGTAPMFPVRLRVVNRKTGTENTYRFEVAHHRMFSADFLFIATFSAIDTAEPVLDPTTVELEFTLHAKGREPVTIRRTSVRAWGGAAAGAMDAAEAVFRILGNPFERAGIEGVEIEAGVRREERAAKLLAAWPDRNEAAPGETVPVHVLLKPFRGDEVRQTFAVAVPPDAAPGGAVRWEITAGAETPPEIPPAASLDDVLAALAAEHPATALVARTNLPSAALRYRGRTLDRLPRGVLGALLPSLTDRAELAPDRLTVLHETGYVMTDKAVIEIRVK